MKKLAIVALLVAKSALAQDNQDQATESMAVADRLLSCAATYAHHIKILQAMNQNVDSQYKFLGYYKAAGEAYSSKEYADKKYSSLRETLVAKMDQAMSSLGVDNGAAAQAFSNSLQTEIRDCGQFQREHSTEIKDRLVKSGLLK